MGTSSSPPPPPRFDQPPTLSNPPPTESSLDIYCDGSFLHETRMAAYGIVITDTHGFVIEGKADPTLVSSPVAAEASAILEAISLALSFEG
ncbi:hypothetical protein LINPERHAP2_LOCUS39615 [Linum perenne]